MLTSVDEQHENGQQTKNDPHFLLFGNLVTVRSDFRPRCVIWQLIATGFRRQTLNTLRDFGQSSDCLRTAGLCMIYWRNLTFIFNLLKLDFVFFRRHTNKRWTC